MSESSSHLPSSNGNGRGKADASANGHASNGNGHKAWTVDDSAALYNLKGWGLKYFGINPEGNLSLHPRRDAKRSIDMKRVVDDVVGRGIKLPILFRFQDVLRHRVEQLNEAFKKAIDEHKYQGKYFGVYPIKVNQLREVVEEILDAGAPYHFGLEAGSKGELIAVLAMNRPDALTIVNGYKDESMLRLAMLGLKLGKKVIVVIEKPSELEILLRTAKEMSVRPLIGLRSKLQSQGTGKWASSSGESAKFGLTTPEILAAARTLQTEGLADCLKMVHFHIGSQVTDIRAIKEAVKEGARVYAKLKKLGMGLEYLDCGGGLAVDYDGTHSSRDSSTNYTLREYTRDLVYVIQEVCAQEKVAEPHIVTESGRAIVAHHSVLVVNVFGAIEAGAAPLEPTETPSEHRVVSEMRGVLRSLDSNPRHLAESLHDAQELKEQAFSLFNLGYLELDDKAKVETLFWRVCQEIHQRLPTSNVPEELQEIVRALLDQYLCNFSLFQSLPDSWAIGQLFPIMPLQRLDEQPARRTTLVDITCDSDGKISQFSCHRKSGGALPVHPLNGEAYYLGIFLMGAYQATMGDIHNLFGRVNEVHVFEDENEPGGYYIEEVIQGQTVRDVLADIQYSDFELAKNVKAAIDAQVKSGQIKPREGVDLLNFYESVMQEYTYIDHAAGKTSANGRPVSLEPPPQAAPTR